MNQPPSTPQSASTPPTLEQQRSKLAELVQNFTPTAKKRFCSLQPHAEHIVALRTKGASFTMVRDILRSAGIKASAATISRFLREESRKKSSAANAQKNSATLKTSAPAFTHKPVAPPPRDRPRIADPDNL